MRFRRRSWRAARPSVPHCRRRALPRRLKAAIMLRQAERCADCGTLLIAGSIVFDHRPPLALRDVEADPNDPDLVAAICRPCNTSKTARDLRAIAQAKRFRPFGTTRPSAVIGATLNQIRPLVAAGHSHDGAGGNPDLTDCGSIDNGSRTPIECPSGPCSRVGPRPASDCLESTPAAAQPSTKSAERRLPLHPRGAKGTLWDLLRASIARLRGRGGEAFRPDPEEQSASSP
jgi:hypothetical protein